MSETERMLVQVVTWLSCSVFIMFMMFWMKRTFQKRADRFILAEVIPRAGVSYNVLVPVAHKTIDVLPDGKLTGKVKELRKSRNKAKSYVIGDRACFPARYPENFPRILQASILKVVIREDNVEPVSNISGNPLFTPEMLNSLKNEVSLELAMLYTKELKEAREEAMKQLNPKLIMGALVVIGLLTAFTAYYIYSKFPDILQAMEVMKAALGN